MIVNFTDPHRPHRNTDALLEAFQASLAIATRPIQYVYPFYIASRVKQGLLAAKEADAEKIITEVGEIESLGNSRYGIKATDMNGTKYRITIEVVE